MIGLHALAPDILYFDIPLLPMAEVVEGGALHGAYGRMLDFWIEGGTDIYALFEFGNEQYIITVTEDFRSDSHWMLRRLGEIRRNPVTLTPLNWWAYPTYAPNAALGRRPTTPISDNQIEDRSIDDFVTYDDFGGEE